MKKVLLLSGYKPFLTRNSSLLISTELQIFTAKSGGEALRLHEAYSFDLIFVDFNLEDMGGDTFCSLIRKGKNSPQVPIIITCHNVPGSIERVELCGASSILIKPIEPINLIETIGNYLDLQLVRSKRVVLKVNVLSKACHQEFVCFSHDISNAGILLETEYPLDLGTRITCKFTLPGTCLIEVEGEVTRFMTGLECEDLYGVKFVTLPTSYRRAIDKYIASIPIVDARSHNIPPVIEMMA
jgi:CheY-like chemotaxis protein